MYPLVIMWGYAMLHQKPRFKVAYRQSMLKSPGNVSYVYALHRTKARTAVDICARYKAPHWYILDTVAVCTSVYSQSQDAFNKFQKHDSFALRMSDSQDKTQINNKRGYIPANMKSLQSSSQPQPRQMFPSFLPGACRGLQ